MASQPWIPAACASLPPRSWPSFNGAMASQPWILPAEGCLGLMILCLQWSHGLSAMDTRWPQLWTPRKATLQWSHGLSAMDTSPPVAQRRGHAPSFNGAMASQPWIQATHAVPPGTPWPFNGAMASQPWIHRIRQVGRQMFAPPSMEPWPLSHGYRFTRLRRFDQIGPSMEPWPLSHGYLSCCLQIQPNLCPSMEPWPLSHGYNCAPWW